MKFKAALKLLESSGSDRSGALGWRIVDVPFDVKEAFGKGGTVPVVGTVNGFAFRTSLFPRKAGKHFLPMNKAMQKGSGAINLGDKIEVILELDTLKRTVKTPELLAGFLAEDEDLRKYFDAMSYSMRKYMSDFITQAKSKDVQQRRAEQLAVTLFEMRDGEETPPPVLAAEFAKNPKAKAGWEKMSASHKRSHLWGIFYYKNPESRAKRVEKAIQAMVEKASKK
jgi:uncharacterized protein YdeI (YjbR/CyaY-like superfamily)